MTAPSKKIEDEIFNIGFQNMSIADLAYLVQEVVQEEFPEKSPIEIVTTPSDDNRSYHINSDKIKNKLGFQPRYSIQDAVRGLCHAFKAGQLPDALIDDNYYNVRTMKKNSIK